MRAYVFRSAPNNGHRATTAACPSCAMNGSRRTSLDHLVGDCEHARWDVQAERFGGLEVDHQLELGRSNDRQVGGLLALENAAGVDADLAIGIGKARSIADQTTSRRVLAILIDRRHPLSLCQRLRFVRAAC